MRVSFDHIRATLMAFAILVTGTTCAAASAEQLAKTIRIDNVHFRAATLQEAVDYLHRKAQKQLTGEQKLHIYCTELSLVRLTFHFPSQPLHDSLREIARQTTLPLHTTQDSLFFGTSGEPLPVAPEHRLREEDNLRESVFRYLFSYNDAELAEGVSAYFISIDERDPTDAFLSRFAGHRLPVKKSSTAPKGKQRVGLSFSVGGLRWLSETKAEIHGNFPGGGHVYEATHTTKGWRVTKEMAGWIE